METSGNIIHHRRLSEWHQKRTRWQRRHRNCCIAIKSYTSNQRTNQSANRPTNYARTLLLSSSVEHSALANLPRRAPHRARHRWLHTRALLSSWPSTIAFWTHAGKACAYFLASRISARVVGVTPRRFRARHHINYSCSAYTRFAMRMTPASLGLLTLHTARISEMSALMNEFSVTSKMLSFPMTDGKIVLWAFLWEAGTTLKTASFPCQSQPQRRKLNTKSDALWSRLVWVDLGVHHHRVLPVIEHLWSKSHVLPAVAAKFGTLTAASRLQFSLWCV